MLGKVVSTRAGCNAPQINLHRSQTYFNQLQSRGTETAPVHRKLHYCPSKLYFLLISVRKFVIFQVNCFSSINKCKKICYCPSKLYFSIRCKKIYFPSKLLFLLISVRKFVIVQVHCFFLLLISVRKFVIVQVNCIFLLGVRKFIIFQVNCYSY